MEKDIRTIVKKNSFAVALIVLGALIFYWVRDYKEVPSGIGPAFFPKIVAAMMIVLSIISIVMPDDGAVETADKSATFNIFVTTISLVGMVVIMKYIHPILGIILFLCTYLKVIAKLKTAQTAIITAVGTVILYVVILVLRIPM